MPFSVPSNQEAMIHLSSQLLQKDTMSVSERISSCVHRGPKHFFRIRAFQLDQNLFSSLFGFHFHYSVRDLLFQNGNHLKILEPGHLAIPQSQHLKPGTAVNLRLGPEHELVMIAVESEVSGGGDEIGFEVLAASSLAHFDVSDSLADVRDLLHEVDVGGVIRVHVVLGHPLLQAVGVHEALGI